MDSLVVLGGGGVLASSAPADVISPALLDEAFGLFARVLDDPVGGGPLVVPIRRRDALLRV